MTTEPITQVGRRLYLSKTKWVWYNLNYQCPFYQQHKGLGITVCEKYQHAFSQFWHKSPCVEKCGYVIPKLPKLHAK